MQDPDLISAAVFNNAVWCDAVCQALGCDTDFVDDLWINSGTSPPFYPNAISLTRAGSEAQFRRIGQMVRAGLPSGWTEKDSFSALDLAQLGLAVLFEAEWLGLQAGSSLFGADRSGATWEPVSTDAGLAAWEAAWRAAHGHALSEQSPARVFMPELLDDPDIVLLAAHRQAETVGLVVANRSDDGSGPVVGISNLVLPEDDRGAYRAGAVAAVMSTFPDLSVVGYERGSELDAMVELGFERLGALRVWTTP
ncbi:MAG: hypothetical protein M3P84_04100 [Chloroflexota bacterium]|nr:hypothetical protein [Chloroflexota bacterium]